MINKEIKMQKIVYVDYAYHFHTKSNHFLRHYIEEYYNVEYVSNNAYTLNPNNEPNLTYIDESYYAVIFFQLISENMIRQIKCKNIIFFPMYDESTFYPEWYWYMLWKHNIKIISFSKTLHDHIIKFGMDCLYIQYFIEPVKSVNPDNDFSLFFWIRGSDTIFEWNIVKKLIDKTKIDSFHIHYENKDYSTSTNNCPIEEDKKLFNVTESDWFNTKEEYISKILSKNIYIAPRKMEGIGLSFIEAMAMGKIIIAVDAPTMNEYIIDGYNGYLFNCDNPKPINFKNIEILKNNAYEYAKQGYDRWIKNRIKIIETINSVCNHSTVFTPLFLTLQQMEHILYLENIIKQPFSHKLIPPYNDTVIIENIKEKKRQRTFLEYIFSIYTLEKFVEIYILGIKVSIKRKKYV